MIQTKATVVSNEQLAEDFWRLTIDAGQIASTAEPGQFINARISEANDPLFRRPFSVFRRIALPGGAQGIQIVYRVVGRGTRAMTRLASGSQLDVIGPLGHAFQLVPQKKTHVLLAGGTGAASLFMIGEKISRAGKRDGLDLRVLLGAKAKQSVILEKEFASLGGKIQISTDDGSLGFHGTVTDMFKQSITEGGIPTDCAVYACGPEQMLEDLAVVCRQHHITAQVSLERNMMCGVGACLVCVCRVDKQNALKRRRLESSHMVFTAEKTDGYALVCKDGPVFDIDEVVFGH